eukprot:TRINITY_DN20576_c0_g1_i2.p1 TRINITY_DN20576_c0_g1~~TRINITY_DN20576_c0_g1_i2.p1  ORF type:complete len:281 (-),score=43.17 TRINITY_DN20576_c0_g1_i2:185-1027(-)
MANYADNEVYIPGLTLRITINEVCSAKHSGARLRSSEPSSCALSDAIGTFESSTAPGSDSSQDSSPSPFFSAHIDSAPFECHPRDSAIMVLARDDASDYERTRFMSEATTAGDPATPGSALSQNSSASFSNSAESSSSAQPPGEQRTDAAPFKLSPGDTTVMVRDLPCKVGYERMMAELKSFGFDGLYDFIFFPTSRFGRSSYKGFCFINFMTRDAVDLFVSKFADYRFAGISSKKAVRLDRAEIQGREANMAILRTSGKRVEYRENPEGLRADDDLLSS